MKVSNYLVKFFKAEFLVGLGSFCDKHTVHHFQNILISEVLSNKPRDLFQLLKSNLSSSVFVVEVKNFPNSVPGSVLSSLFANNFNELVKVENFVFFSQCPYDIDNVRISFVESELFKNLDDLLRINGSTSIFIKDQEHIPQLLVILLGNPVFPLLWYLFLLNLTLWIFCARVCLFLHTGYDLN